MNAAGYGHALGHVIGLAFCLAAPVWALVWLLLGTRSGRLICRATARVMQGPARRRALAQAQEHHNRYVAWRANLEWWAQAKRRHVSGTVEHETAQDMLQYFDQHRVPPCYCASCISLCAGTGATCVNPTCNVHLRSHR